MVKYLCSVVHIQGTSHGVSNPPPLSVYWHAVIAIGQSIQLHGYVYKYTDKNGSSQKILCVVCDEC